HYFLSSAIPTCLRSFPTRRSSDLPLLLGRIEPNACSPHHVLFGALFSFDHSCGRSDKLLSLRGRSSLTGERYAFVKKVRIGLLVDRKSTRLKSSHVIMSYAVCCVK